MTGKRSYNDACGMGRALDIVGERWAMHVARELLLGPKRFTDLRTALPGLSADVLAQRLRELEEAGVVAKRRLGPPVPAQVYELTEWGRELEPALVALSRWGARAAPPTQSMCMSMESHLVSLRTLFDPDRAAGVTVSVGLRFGDHHFRADVADGAISVERGDPAAADATVVTDPAIFLALLHGERTLADAVDAGDVEFSGDRRAFKRFLGLFPLPAPAV